MNRNELIHAVAQKAGLSLEQAGAALEAVLGTVVEAVNKGENVVLLGFGSFSVITREAHNGRNPSTGEAMKIPARKVVRFRAGGKMKPE